MKIFMIVLLIALLTTTTVFSHADENKTTYMPWEPIGVSGYVRNTASGEVKVSSPDLVQLNKAKKKSWARLGYNCRIDCRGHDAGYAWAEENNFRDKSDCTARSRSFKEGCWAYVRYNN